MEVWKVRGGFCDVQKAAVEETNKTGADSHVIGKEIEIALGLQDLTVGI